MNKILILPLIAIAIVLSAYSSPTSDHTRFGAPSTKGKMIKRAGYVLLYDVSKKCPLWVSYHLKSSQLVKKIKKQGEFKADTTLAGVDRAYRDDFTGKYEKCPMAPVADMSYSIKTFDEAFILSNVCAMDRGLKQGKWRELEDAIRAYITNIGDAWVVTGPVFDERKKTAIMIRKYGVYLPDGFFKVLLYQSKDYGFHAIAFYMDNKRQDKPLKNYCVGYGEIEEMTGLVFFKGLPEEVRRILKKTPPESSFFVQ